MRTATAADAAANPRTPKTRKSVVVESPAGGVVP
jgi:hypothetical protein